MRGIVRLRRRRRVAAAGSAVVLAAGVTVALVANGGSDAPPGPALADVPGVHTAARIGSAVQLVANAHPLTTSDTKDEAAVVAAEQRLAIKLLQTVPGRSNTTVSPASLYLALGMLQDGARGQTATEIAHALQADGLSTAAQNAGLATLTHDLTDAAKAGGISLESANSLWQQRGLPLRHQYLADLARYYASGVWQVDFTHHMPAALDAINQWTSQHTHGKITKLFDQLDPMTVLVLANAIYFKAAWQTPFDGRLTDDDTFTTGTGKHVHAEFMTGGDGLSSGAGHGWEAAQLPYVGRRYAALAVMPTHKSLARFSAGLTPNMIDSIASSLTAGTEVDLPRLSTTSKVVDLRPVLQGLGMRRAFESDANLSGLSAAGISVDQVMQRVYLRVGEKGTTAAAATGISGVLTSLHPSVRFDHPFLFLIRDTQTGAILFASRITNPAAT